MTAPLRVGVIGCGNVALNLHLPAYQAPTERWTVVALADPTPERLELGRGFVGRDQSRVHLDGPRTPYSAGDRLAGTWCESSRCLPPGAQPSPEDRLRLSRPCDLLTARALGDAGAAVDQ